VRDEEGCCSKSTSHQTVAPAPPTPSVEAISSKAGEIATKIEDGGETEAVAGKTHSKTSEKFEEVKKNIPEPDLKVREEVEPTTMRQTGVTDSQEPVKVATDQQVAGNNNNKVSLLKSDSGFAESIEESRNVMKHSVSKQQPSGESVKAIYKSDSGFSEHSGVPSFEEDDIATPVKVKQISVEQAHNMFEKRYSSMLGQDDLAMFGSKSDPIPAPKKVSNIIDEEDDTDEETDTDDSDEDSVAVAKGSFICSGSLVLVKKSCLPLL